MAISSLRNFYISQGAIKPDEPTKWTSSHKTLRMDVVGRVAAEQHIYEYEYNKYMGFETDFPQEQLPDCVREYWEDHKRV